MSKLILALIVFVSFVPAFAQEVPRIGEVIDVTVANVDVVVTDRSGKPVRGLTKDDFQLFESGKPQTITHFSEFTSRGDATAAQSDATPRPPRTMVIFVDRTTIRGPERARFFDEVKKLVRNTIEAGDQAAVVSWFWGVRTRCELTDNVAKLEQTLDVIAKEPPYIESDQQMAIATEREMVAEAVDPKGAGSSGIGISATQGDSATRALLEMRQKARALGAIMKSMAGADGQKIVVLVSHRFSTMAGAEYLRGAGLMQSRQFAADREIGSVIEAANRNGVTVYAIHPETVTFDAQETASYRGPQSTAARGAALAVNESRALEEVAERTGGVAAWGIGGVTKAMQQLDEDLDSYYSLGYEPAKDSDGRHQISVKLKNGGGYRVRIRSEIVTRPPDVQLRDRVIGSLFHPAHVEGIPVQVFLKKPRRERELIFLPLQIRVPMSGLTLLSDGKQRTGGFKVLLAWGGQLGSISEVRESHQPIAVPESEAAAALSKFVTYELEIAAPTTIDRAVIAVVDDRSRELGLVRFDMPRLK
ncbi:MAG TPA: VWA domain-containing protein [Thermoanaerobaculia bacterium]|nr:VWA domain-containing protein [Thermoanaerobaculia bacterium]